MKILGLLDGLPPFDHLEFSYFSHIPCRRSHCQAAALLRSFLPAIY